MTDYKIYKGDILKFHESRLISGSTTHLLWNLDSSKSNTEILVSTINHVVYLGTVDKQNYQDGDRKWHVGCYLECLVVMKDGRIIKCYMWMGNFGRGDFEDDLG